LKQYPPEPKPETLNVFIARARMLEEMGVSGLAFSGVGTEIVERLAALVHRYDVDDLKHFASTKRHALIACFLAEAYKTTLDRIVEMNRVSLTGMNRRAKNAAERQQKDVRESARRGLQTVLHATELLADKSRSRDERLEQIFAEYDEQRLADAVAVCRE